MRLSSAAQKWLSIPSLLLVTLQTLVIAEVTSAEREVQYCIVGAGPGGIQLAHFLFHAGRDYLLFERNPIAGSFFAKYPRHRMLISLNKRNVREGRSHEFAMRHDWNSLLDVRPEENWTAPVTQRSKLLFPRADVLTEYLGEFVTEQLEHVRYNHTVKKIRRLGGTASPTQNTGFILDIVDSNTKAPLLSQQCREVIWSTGLWNPRGAKVRVDGAKLTQGYESMPATGESFEGKAVLVLGMGNAAMETAQELQKYTSEIHLFARARPLPEGGRGVRFAWQTHYVGDIRAGRMTLLDTYLLKSLDTFDFNALDGDARLKVFSCETDRKCAWRVHRNDCADQLCTDEHLKGGQGLNYYLPVGKFYENSTKLEHVRAWLQKYAPHSGTHGLAFWEFSDQQQPNGPQNNSEVSVVRVSRAGSTEANGKYANIDMLNGRKLFKQINGTHTLSFLDEMWALQSERGEILYVSPSESFHMPVKGWRPREGWRPAPLVGLESMPEPLDVYKERRKNLGIDEAVFEGKIVELRVSSKLLDEQPQLIDGISKLHQRYSNDFLRYPLDHIIRCFGWVMDSSVFDESVPVMTTHSGKYPKVKQDFEAESVPGLRFGGTLLHSLDFRQSSGGFIHGFRYTARATFRMYEEKNHGIPWPHQVFQIQHRKQSVAEAAKPLMKVFQSRINEAAGPYQMFEFLGDMIVFEKHSKGVWNATFLEEVPLALFHERYKDKPRITWVFKYNEDFHGPEVLGQQRVGSTEAITAEKSNFLHPHIGYFPAGTSSNERTMGHWLTEDIFTSWTTPESIVPFWRFMARAVTDAASWPDKHEWNRGGDNVYELDVVSPLRLFQGVQAQTCKVGSPSCDTTEALVMA